MTKPSEAIPVFPLAVPPEPNLTFTWGSTLWDYYAVHCPLDHTNLTAAAVQAAQALPRNATAEDCLRVACQHQAFIAAAYADAMLAERSKREEGAP